MSHLTKNAKHYLIGSNKIMKRVFLLFILTFTILWTGSSLEVSASSTTVPANNHQQSIQVIDKTQDSSDLYDYIGMNQLADILKLPNGDVRETATRLINVSLGFLGIIFLILILKGGFLFMISGGKKEKMEEARGSIVSAIIGLIIILSAWSIVTFVINSLLDATNGDLVSINYTVNNNSDFNQILKT